MDKLKLLNYAIVGAKRNLEYHFELCKNRAYEPENIVRLKFAIEDFEKIREMIDDERSNK